MTSIADPQRHSISPTTQSEQVARLLRRYPTVGPADERAIIRFLKEGRSLEIHRLTSDERLRANLGAFIRDHKEELQLKWREVAMLVGLSLAVLAPIWLLT